jgi:hypothetical protein
MNELLIFETPEEVKIIRLYLTRSGKGGYILRADVVGQDGKANKAEKRYPRKEFGEMKVIIQRLLSKLETRGLKRNQISFESALMNFNALT